MDVSFGFVTRIPFIKRVKSSKLDSLLERRVKQHSIEEGQRRQVPVPKPQTPAPSSPTTSALNTPTQPPSAVRPHNLPQTQFALDRTVKVEKPSTAETPGSGEVPSPAPGSAQKDVCSTCTGDDSLPPQNQVISLQDLKGDLMERTTKPTQAVLERSGQETVKRSQEEEGGGSEGIHSSMEKEPKTEEHNLNMDIVRTGSFIFDQNCSQNAPKPNQQSTEALRSLHSGKEKNGMAPSENNENMQEAEGDGTLKSVSPLPQVNGNDGSGSDGVLSSSAASANNGALANSTQPTTNSFSEAGEQSPGLLLKDGLQQKPLVNGDVAAQVDKDGGAHGPNQTSKPEVDCEGTIPDQDYQPPLKVSRVDNDVDALKEDAQCSRRHGGTPPFQSEESAASACKIIRMAPSPIPSAEESSLSNDFTEVFSPTRMTEPRTTIITQVATTSITTTTTVVSTQTKTSGDTSTPVASTSESSAVSTLSTMTKTTVTKICSSGLDSQSEDSQSETVTQDQKMSVTSTVGPGGKVSVSSVTVSQEEYSSTKGRVRLLRFSRTKKTRSDTALPSYCKFVTKSNRKSIFVLPHDDLKVLGRRGGFRDVPIFSYNAKPAWDIWPYPSPRPTFGLTWRLVLTPTTFTNSMNPKNYLHD